VVVAELVTAELVTAELVTAELAMHAELAMLVVVARLLMLAAHRPETACSTAESDVQSRVSLAVVTVADVQPLLQAADVLLLLQAAVASNADRT